MTQQTQQPAASVSDQLNNIGEDQGIARNDRESDADFAERLVYELDLQVEQLWAAQDKIRELVPVDA